MRSLLGVTLVACLAIALAGLVRAQQEIPFDAFGVLEYMLQDQDAVKEMKLTNDQLTKAKAVSRQVREKHKGDLAKLKDVPKEAYPQKLRDLEKTVAEQTIKGLAGTLKPDQLKRFKQLELQNRGLIALSDPEVEKTLKLTDDQKGKIKTMYDAIIQERFVLFKDAQNDATKIREVFRKAAAKDKEGLEKASALLNDDQKKVWKELMGELFEFKVVGGLR
jgi:hypothetical protein